MKYNLNDRKFTKNKFIRVGYNVRGYDVSVDMYTFVEEIWYSMADLHKRVYIGVNNLYDDIYTAVVYNIVDDLMIVTKDYRLINVVNLNDSTLLNRKQEVEGSIIKCYDYLIAVDDEGFKVIQGEK